MNGSLTARSAFFLAFLITLFTSPVAAHAATPDAGPSATQVLQRAESQARTEHKNILLEFGATWCVNCKLYDLMLNDASMRAILSPHFVFAYMDSGEHRGDTRHVNTPGAVDFENSVGGKSAGWPFLVILNPDGKPIVDSNRPDAKSKTGDNIGYPVLPQEVDWFIEMLKRGAPSLSRQDLASVHAWLTERAAKLPH
jgi:thioredoxin-related protein